MRSNERYKNAFFSPKKKKNTFIIYEKLQNFSSPLTRDNFITHCLFKLVLFYILFNSKNLSLDSTHKSNYKTMNLRKCSSKSTSFTFTLPSFAFPSSPPMFMNPPFKIILMSFENEYLYPISCVISKTVQWQLFSLGQKSPS